MSVPWRGGLGDLETVGGAPDVREPPAGASACAAEDRSKRGPLMAYPGAASELGEAFGAGNVVDLIRESVRSPCRR